jgi:hypothetical protein
MWRSAVNEEAVRSAARAIVAKMKREREPEPALICEEVIKQFVEGQQGDKIQNELSQWQEHLGLNVDPVITQVIAEVFNITLKAWKPCPSDFPSAISQFKKEKTNEVVSMNEHLLRPILFKSTREKGIEFCKTIAPTLIADRWRKEFGTYCFDRVKANAGMRQELWALLQLGFTALVINDLERKTFTKAILKMNGRCLPNDKEGFFLRSA